MAFEIPESALPREPESIERLMWRVDPEIELSEPIELDARDQAFLALYELQRPPWWQDLERERRAAAREAASYR